MQADLFGASMVLPEGFAYQPAFLSEAEERSLIEIIRALPLAEAQYKQFSARRRTVSYGFEYDFSRNAMLAAPAIPQFLDRLRAKAAVLIGVQAQDFVHALVSEYRPGAPLGWHRDVPQFEAIVGISLAASCRMRLRPYNPGGRNARADVIALDLQPRSAYVMRGPARWAWQHCIVEPKELRYSITLRTARRTGA